MSLRDTQRIALYDEEGRQPTTVPIAATPQLSPLDELKRYITGNRPKESGSITDELSAIEKQIGDYYPEVTESTIAADLLKLAPKALGDESLVATQAVGTILLAFPFPVETPLVGSYVTIGTSTYKFVEEFSDPSVANEILIVSTEQGTAANLKKALSGDVDGLGSAYSNGTEALDGYTVTDTSVSDGGVQYEVVTITANAYGTDGNIALTSSNDLIKIFLFDGKDSRISKAGEFIYTPDKLYFCTSDTGVDETTKTKYIELSPSKEA